MGNKHMDNVPVQQHERWQRVLLHIVHCIQYVQDVLLQICIAAQPVQHKRPIQAVTHLSDQPPAYVPSIQMLMCGATVDSPKIGVLGVCVVCAHGVC